MFVHALVCSKVICKDANGPSSFCHTGDIEPCAWRYASKETETPGHFRAGRAWQRQRHSGIYLPLDLALTLQLSNAKVWGVMLGVCYGTIVRKAGRGVWPAAPERGGLAACTHAFWFA